jgi:hypothetical protein
LWFGHGDALSGRRSFRHFSSLANGKATHLRVNPNAGGDRVNCCLFRDLELERGLD